MKAFHLFLLSSLGLLAAVTTSPAQSNYEPYSFSTFAGLAGSQGTNDGTGTSARFIQPLYLAVDGAGNVYVSDFTAYTIRKITPSGVVSTFAGSGNCGGANGNGTAAQFCAPTGVAVDGAGNVYVAENLGTIRKITPSGTVSTLAGSFNTSGSVDATGSAARFAQPRGLAVDSAGNVYVADQNNYTIRKITPGGSVSTLAGLAGNTAHVDGTGSAARFTGPLGIAVDGTGNVYVADVDSTIRKITPGGVVSTLAGFPNTGNSTDGAGSAARFRQPEGIAVDGAGNAYIADSDNSTVRKVTPAGVVTTLAGLPLTVGASDGTGSTARFRGLVGIAVDGAGKLYVADTGNPTIRVGVVPPPAITSPLTASTVIGQPFVYQFQATNAASLGVTNLPAGLTFNPSLSAIIGTPTFEGTFPVGLSASNAGGTTNATLTLTVQPAPTGPLIISSTAATGRTGSPFQFQVITSGGSAATRLSVSALPAGLTFDAVTGLISGTSASEGSTAVTLTVTDGSFMNASILQLTFTADPAVPVIISSSSTSITSGQSFSYTINAPATSDPSDVTTYSLVGTLPNGLSFNAATGVISGTPTTNSARKPQSPNGIHLSGGIVTNIQIFATNSHGTSTLPLNFFLAPVGAVNIATRLAVGTGNNVLIAGFIITGNAPKKVILRAIGPSLPIPGVLQDPILDLHDGASALGSNDNWRDSQENEIIATSVAPAENRESAIVATLTPGNYTAAVSGRDNTTGIAVVELYDLGTASLDTSSQAQLAQISTRGTVQGGDSVMIGGFIISGQASKVIVRAIGPSLNGVLSGALQDPLLELHDGSGALINSNDDWRSTQQQQIIDTTVPPTDDRESAIVATLAPGNYTGIVRGKDDATGTALVEVYGLK